MDSLAAAPGTGPATSPLPVLRKPRPAAKFTDLPTDRALVMGILNVTPDSFSDGGDTPPRRPRSPTGLQMHYGGADIIDVGGESTRPGATSVTLEEEQSRILPVIEALAKAGALVSVDTMHVDTAARRWTPAPPSSTTSPADLRAGDAGAGGRHKVPYILMHRRGTPAP